MNSPECYHKFILLEILQKQAPSYYKRLQKRGGEGVGKGVQETFDLLGEFTDFLRRQLIY